MNKSDPVREYLEKLGCPDFVVRGGLPGLVERWEATVEAVKDGYALGLDDYLNDMDGRQLLENVLGIVSPAESARERARVRKADERMRKLVKPAGRCLWGREAARRDGWTPERNWWYFSRPVRGGADLLEDLRNAEDD